MEEVLEEREKWAVDDGVKGGEKKEKS
jgi:hypothetical protein